MFKDSSFDTVEQFRLNQLYYLHIYVFQYLAHYMTHVSFFHRILTQYQFGYMLLFPVGITSSVLADSVFHPSDSGCQFRQIEHYFKISKSRITRGKFQFLCIHLRQPFVIWTKCHWPRQHTCLPNQKQKQTSEFHLLDARFLYKLISYSTINDGLSTTHFHSFSRINTDSDILILYVLLWSHNY